MNPLLEMLLARFRADPDTAFTAEEIDLLRGERENPWALKAYAIHCWRLRDYEQGLEVALRILDLEPNDESVVNACVFFRELARPAEALALLQKHKRLLQPIRFADLMCSLLAFAGDAAGAVRFGDQALQLKDGGIPALRQQFRTLSSPSKRSVVSFSIWGTQERYIQGAINNVIVGRYLYPDWSVRFYTDESTPAPFRTALASLGAEVVCPDLPARDYGLFWRFLVEDDEDVDVFIVRDADSVTNIKERVAVAEWLESGKAFHVLRDDLQHSELILAGMWGAVRGNIGGMRQRILDYVTALPRVGNYVHKDQHFLREVIWPIAKGSLCTHDRWFNFMEPRRYDPRFTLPKQMHIGQNDRARSTAKTKLS